MNSIVTSYFSGTSLIAHSGNPESYLFLNPTIFLNFLASYIIVQ
ncbi:MAG: hypothetical protein QW806_10430 [Nitrososphaerota archaeon]